MLFFLKNLAITGGLFMVVANGAGAYSIDNRQTDRSSLEAAHA